MESVQAGVIESAKRTHVRYWIVVMLFIITSFYYGDRATLAIASAPMSHDLGLSSVSLGFVFSAFSWAYVIAQIPAGWLLDRFGSKKVYWFSIFFWSVFTLFQGFVKYFDSMTATIIVLFFLRFMIGLSEAPAFPGNSRIVAAWFPAQERGTAVAIFNSAQYFATVIFAPVMGWLIHLIGWTNVFFVMGAMGIVLSYLWTQVIHSPKDHPHINKQELEYIEKGGALTNMDQTSKQDKSFSRLKAIGQLLRSRMIMGTYLGQYCINALTYFFITWFPVYLVQARGMSLMKAGLLASVPALCGFVGGVLGGMFSDHLLARGHTLTLARKTPIVAGMFLAMSMIFCNYVETEWVVVVFMAMSFFGKAFGALGWACMADMAPKEISGLSGGLFNMFGNLSGIVTPIAIGFIIQSTGSFNGALVFVGVHAAVAIISFLFVVGPINRVVLVR